MRSYISRRSYFPILLSSLSFLAACTPAQQIVSRPDAAEIPQTSVKHQSIGNCWAYATTGWIESLHKKATGNDIDLSETWISFWSSYYRLVWDETGKEAPAEGGGYDLARGILADHGFILEGDFIPEEEGRTYSERQEAAMEYLAEQSKEGGRLYGKESRSHENVIKELNAAFGVEIEKAFAKAKPARVLVIHKDGMTLDVLLKDPKWQWRDAFFPAMDAKNPQATIQQRLDIIKRVQRAINDDIPVILNFWVAMGAIDQKDGGFKMETLKSNGDLGTQGGHMVVITDYVADNVPGIGTVGEGAVSPEIREAALKGDLRYFKVKNSWGVDRSERGLTDGYSKLYLDYLMEEINWNVDDQKFTASPVQSFILPPGY